MPAVPHVNRLKIIYSAPKSLNFGFRPLDYLQTPAQNGIGIYTPQVHRITFTFCRQCMASAGMRAFVATRLADVARAHPSVAIYAQPVRFSQPLMTAEYGCGRTLIVHSKNASAEEVERDVHTLLGRSGLPAVKLVHPQSASVPSVQGEWTPITWLPPEMNSTPLPNKAFSKFKTAELSATEYVKLHYQKDNNSS